MGIPNRQRGTCDGSWVNTTATSASVSGLSNSTTYYWQVRAVTDYAVTDANVGAPGDTAGPWWIFTTEAGVPPEEFGKSSPSDLASAQPASLSLSWAASAGAVSYETCYDTTNDSVCDGAWTSTTLTNASVSGLSYAVTYYWQVRAFNLAGTTYANGGAWASFTTQIAPPAAFTKTLPYSGALSQSIAPTLTWGASFGAASYETCYDTTNNSVCDGSWASSAGATASLSGLNYAATYYWQVRAVNSTGTILADGGAWASFTTKIAPPAAFGKSSPSSGAVSQPLAVTFSWGTSAGAARYEFCFNTSNTSVCSGLWTSLGTDTSVSLNGLSYATTYYWQVRAVNGTGTTEADGGTWSTFTVIEPPVVLHFVYLPLVGR